MKVKEAKEKYDIKDLEAEIKKIAVSARALVSSKLKPRTIALLIKDQFTGTGPTLVEIEVVLEIASELDKRHFLPTPTKQGD